MNKEVKDNGRFTLKLILILVLFPILVISCFNREEVPRNKNIIPEKTFVSILKELHLSNGLFSLPKIRSRLEGDTSMIYIEIIESYGYSKEAMDTTLQYYYIKKPKRLIRIYDQIMGEFTAIQAQLQNENQQLRVTMPNEWTGEKFLELPGDEGSEDINFELELTPPGYYSLRFTATVFPDDQSFKPSCTVVLVYTDVPGPQKRKILPAIRYIKDGHPHDYKIEGTLTGKAKIILKGSFYSFMSDPDFGRPDARIENISFFYSGP